MLRVQNCAFLSAGNMFTFHPWTFFRSTDRSGYVRMVRFLQRLSDLIGPYRSTHIG